MRIPRQRRSRTNRDKPIRVAIIGGGCAGIAAAWQLSQQPGYEIHIYEKSWRLGGKGRSVRDADGRILSHNLQVWLGFYDNAFRMMRECYEEVEKHRWGPDRGPGERLTHRRFADAFFPEPHVGVARPPSPYGDWVAWSGHFPPAKGLPGTKFDEQTNPFTLASYVLRCSDLLKTLVLSVIGTPKEDEPGGPRPDQRSTHDQAVDLDFSVDSTQSLQLLIERTAQLLRTGSLTSAAVLLQSVTMLERWLQKFDDFAPQATNSIIKLMEAFAAQTRKLLRDFASIDENVRAKTEVIDIVLTILVGFFRDRVLFDERGLDAINQSDYRMWLRQHGATFSSLDSRLLTGIYDVVFAYREGDRSRPALAAGVALRGALRMLFTYRGAMFWRIRSGMGDAVFAPLYKVLLWGRRAKDEDGSLTESSLVRFHFLHEFETAGFAAPVKGRRYVSSLKFKTRGDPADLDRFSSKALDEFGCWPDRPDYCFGEAVKRRINHRELSVGRDFDAVIFAIGIDEVKKACFDIATFENEDAKLPSKWAAMFAQVKTVGTKSAQVWLDRDLPGLGWRRGPGIITALGGAFDTWADMTHTLTAERTWRAGKPKEQNKKGKGDFENVRSAAYFCGAQPESEIKVVRGIIKKALGNRSTTRAKRNLRGHVIALIKTIAIEWGILWNDDLRIGIEPDLDELLKNFQVGPAPSGELENHLLRILLKIKVNSDLTNMLTADMKPVWPAAFSQELTSKSFAVRQHVQASFEDSDRYTLSLPGSLAYRISPLDRSAENMTIAGDWTACGLDIGCVEAAVMSGLLAAHAISGKPELETIVGYDHP